MAMDAADVKYIGKELGADLVGIASADVLNAHPPDPKYPQTPERIWPDCRSVIVIGTHIPAAAFRCPPGPLVQYMDMAVLRRMDRIAWKLSAILEEAGHAAFVTAAQETDWNFKRASYGYLSNRHLAVEAGLGTLGLEVNLLTPEFGPRINFTGILTDLELEGDTPITEQICIGEGCSRCLYSCPSDAVLHFGIDKRRCATEAQEFGYAQITGFFSKFLHTSAADKKKLMASRGLYGFWQGMLRVVGSFGDCPRCLAVCPVGDDYHAYLAEPQKEIPEKTPERMAKGNEYKEIRQTGGDAPGLNEWNVRWVGPEGYTGKVIKAQRQAFKQLQDVRSVDEETRETGLPVKIPPHGTVLNAELIKECALSFGADLMGIAGPDAVAKGWPTVAGAQDAADTRVIVLAQRMNGGSALITGWNNRQKYYNDELNLDALEGAASKLVTWLDDRGVPAIIIPPPDVDRGRWSGDDADLQTAVEAMAKAAVAAGLGTLGLNQQLLTLEFGPRVVTLAVLCNVPLAMDTPQETALCKGADCGRCLSACPADAVGQWDRDWSACGSFRSPHGFAHFTDFLNRIIAEPDIEIKNSMLRSEDSFNIWLSTLRGAGVISGCRRCQDVCPVGDDYDDMLKATLEEIPEDTPEKQSRFISLDLSENSIAYRNRAEWIGWLQSNR